MPTNAASSPAAAVEATCQPTFRVDDAPRTTGTAALVRTRDSRIPVLLLSAHHLLGLASGPLPWQDASKHVTGGVCASLNEARRFSMGAALPIRDAHTLGDLRSLNDISVLSLPDLAAWQRRSALDLADEPPRLGDPVWLVARLKGQPATGDFLHRARVLSTIGYLAYVFDEPHLNTADTSGGPVVDRQGKLVGINVGAGHLASGAQFAVADALPPIRAALSQALTAAQQTAPAEAIR